MFRRFRALVKDRKGAYDLIQFALILPIFVTILYGSFELLKLVSIRQSLDAGTYQAARYLSVYHKSYYDSRYDRADIDDSLRAERLIWESLQANPFISRGMPIRIVVRYSNSNGQELSSPVDFNCRPAPIDGSINVLARSPDVIFTVHAQVMFPWTTSVLGLSMGNVTLASAHTTFVDCGPWYPPPTREPTELPGMGAGG